MTKPFRMTRTVDKTEQPWMSEPDRVEEGATVYIYAGCTYGCIGEGIAVTFQPETEPFFEVPRDAIEPR